MSSECSLHEENRLSALAVAIDPRCDTTKGPPVQPLHHIERAQRPGYFHDLRIARDRATPRELRGAQDAFLLLDGTTHSVYTRYFSACIG